MTRTAAPFRVETITPPADYSEAMAVRIKVFVEEQGVNPEAEADEWDAVDTHWLVRNDQSQAVGAARMTDKGQGLGKVERVAVLQEYRSAGVGRIIMEHMEAHARQAGFTRLVLHAQTQCQGFYEKLGYATSDPTVFDEEGIPHVKMEKPLL